MDPYFTSTMLLPIASSDIYLENNFFSLSPAILYFLAFFTLICGWIINCLKMYKISDEVIKFIEETIKKLENRIDSCMKKFSWGENSERYIPRRCTITISVFNSDDAIRLTLRKYSSVFKLTKSQEKNQSFNVHRRHQTVCQKMTKN